MSKPKPINLREAMKELDKSYYGSKGYTAIWYSDPMRPTSLLTPKNVIKK